MPRMDIGMMTDTLFDVAALFRRNGYNVVIDPHFQSPGEIVSAFPIQPAVFKYGREGVIFVYNDVPFSQRFQFRREIPYSGVFFKEIVHTVDHSSAVTAVDAQSAAGDVRIFFPTQQPFILSFSTSSFSTILTHPPEAT